MAYTSLDKITRSFLLNRQLSIHYYLQGLLYARDCLRELTFDDLKAVSYLTLTPDANNVLKLPCGILDVISVGFPVGQHTRPLVLDNTLTSTTVEPVTYNNTVAGTGWAFGSFDDYGEYIGRQFGYRPQYNDTYKFNKECGTIQVNQCLTFDKAIVQCISDGTDCNAATCVDPYAIATINAYIEWYFDEKGKCGTAGERKFVNERRVLRGRKSDVALDGIKRAIQNSYSK